jgi:hypothetical protein
MATNPKIKVTINVAKIPAPELQEVKLQGILLAEITAETPTKELLQLLKINESWPSYWFDSSGQRIENLNFVNLNLQELPLRLWQFASKRDLDRELEDTFSLEN